ncbi:hypothetical protein [Shewanella sp. 125m-1]
MAISLKKAYAACLWLAEQKLGIPVEHQRGEWDLAKDKELNFSRKDLVISLPKDYFSNSCYLSVTPESCTSIDGDDFSDVEFIDASNFIDGHLFRYTMDDYFQDLSPFRDIPYFLPTNIQEIDFETSPLNIFKQSNLDLVSFDELDHKKYSDEDKPYLALITAHVTLSRKLLNNELTALGIPKSVQEEYFSPAPFFEQMVQPNFDLPKTVIPSMVWRSNVIPNYEISSAEIGLNRLSRLPTQLSQDFATSGQLDSDYELYLSRSEQWFTDITIKEEQDFTNWIMVEVRKLFPTPTQATFKPDSKGYLIQFGTDKPITVRNSKGMSLLYKILKEYRKSSYSIGRGYSAYAIELDNQYDTGMNTKKKSDKHGYEEKLRNQLYDLLSRYFETDNWDKKEEIALAAEKLLPKINALCEQVILTQEYLKTILRKDLDWFVKHGDSLKLSTKIDNNEERKEIESHRKNLENALDKLGSACPHFAYYLGSLASNKPLGLGYSKENKEFYFIFNDDIQWDFG